MSQEETHPFIPYLQRLAAAPQAMRALRRAARGVPGQEPDTFRYVMPWVTDHTSPWQEYV